VSSAVWIGLALVVLALAGGIALVAVRALAAYRVLRGTGRGLTSGVERVMRDSEQVVVKLERVAAGSARLQAALARLSASRARLNVLLEAISQVRAGIGRITGVVPRKG
jgi:hypothetical protein